MWHHCPSVTRLLLWAGLNLVCLCRVDTCAAFAGGFGGSVSYTLPVNRFSCYIRIIYFQKDAQSSEAVETSPSGQRSSGLASCWSGFAEGWCWEGWAALRHPAAVYRSSCSDQPVTFSGITETLFSNQLHTSAELEAPGFGISDKNTWGHHFLTFPSLRPTRKWGVGAMRVSDVVFAGWLLWKRLFHPELCRFLNEAK